MKNLKTFIFLIGLFLIPSCSPAFAALTKAVEKVDPWTQVAQNTIVKGNTIDISGNYQIVLQIDGALTNVTATTNGLRIIVQTSSSEAGNNYWSDLATFSTLSGVTAISSTVVAADVTVGSSTMFLRTMAGFASLGSLIYANSAGTGDLMRILAKSGTLLYMVDGVESQRNINTQLFNQAFTQVVNIPDSASRVRILYDNTGDSAGATCNVRANLLKITGI